MILAIDVQYSQQSQRTAWLGFGRWEDAEAALEAVENRESAPEPYEPGQFYRRELPCVLRATEAARSTAPLEAVVIDGYVWLGPGRPGLGAHLYEALAGEVAVVGVAKTPFLGAVCIPILRGESRQPLYITAEGVDVEAAARAVRAMHGPHRHPTLLKRVDQLARGFAVPRQM